MLLSLAVQHNFRRDKLAPSSDGNISAPDIRLQFVTAEVMSGVTIVCNHYAIICSIAYSDNIPISYQSQPFRLLSKMFFPFHELNTEQHNPYIMYSCKISPTKYEITPPFTHCHSCRMKCTSCSFQTTWPDQNVRVIW